MNSTIWQTKGSITSANGQMVNLVTFNDKSMQIILFSLFRAHHIHIDVQFCHDIVIWDGLVYCDRQNLSHPMYAYHCFSAYVILRAIISVSLFELNTNVNKEKWIDEKFVFEGKKDH